MKLEVRFAARDKLSGKADASKAEKISEAFIELKKDDAGGSTI